MDTNEFDERNFAKSRAVCAEMAEACRKEHDENRKEKDRA